MKSKDRESILRDALINSISLLAIVLAVGVAVVVVMRTLPMW